VQSPLSELAEIEKLLIEAFHSILRLPPKRLALKTNRSLFRAGYQYYVSRTLSTRQGEFITVR
jgi:hypothetical protein